MNIDDEFFYTFSLTKMWSIDIFSSNLYSNRVSILKIPADDVVFSAVLKRSHTVHIGKETFVRCMHVAEFEDKNNHLVFPMTLLQATSVEARFPEFVDEGLMGKWQLSKSNNSLRLKILNSY
jgi:hypothetical protein